MEEPQTCDGDEPKKPPTTFLSLPAELRNYIYDLSGCLVTRQCRYCYRLVRGDHKPEEKWCPVLDEKCEYRGKAYLWVNRCYKRGTYWQGRSNMGCHQHLGIKEELVEAHFYTRIARVSQPNLTRVSKQVRAETLPMYYGGPHIFLFTLVKHLEDEYKAIPRWFSIIGKGSAAMLKEVIVLHADFPTWYQLKVRELAAEQEKEWSVNATWTWQGCKSYRFCCEAFLLPQGDQGEERTEDNA